LRRAGAARGRPRRRRRRGRKGRADAGDDRKLRRDRARPHAAAARRSQGAPSAAGDGRSHAGSDPQRSRRFGRARARPQGRRRRLSRETVLARRIGRARRSARASAKPDHPARTPCVRRRGHRPDRARGLARRQASRADQSRVPHSRIPGAQRGARRHALDAARARVGLQFRSADQHHRPARQPAASEARSARQRAADRDGPRSRLFDPSVGVVTLLRSLSFRLAVLYLAVFAASVATLGGLVYWVEILQPLAEVRDGIETEMEELGEVYRREGPLGLAGALELRAATGGSRGPYHALLDRNGQALTANLPSWPQTFVPGWKRIEADVAREGDEDEYEALVLDR